MGLSKDQIAQRIAQELRDGWYVNLGIGIPTLVANHIPQGINVEFQSENGMFHKASVRCPASQRVDLTAGMASASGVCIIKDPEGDEGWFSGSLNKYGQAHGNGQLKYDSGFVFCGVFLNGKTDEGVLYDCEGETNATMKSGSWTDCIDCVICIDSKVVPRAYPTA